ncbi:hypothetical protein FQZ97_974820 [compost metagenome]
MCRTSAPDCDLNNSPARCRPLPTPGEAYESVSGLALARAIRSATDLMPVAGWVTSTLGVLASMATGTKSFSMLKGNFGISVGLMVRLPAGITSSVWPSGLPRLTLSMPMLPAAPGALSTRAVWL